MLTGYIFVCALNSTIWNVDKNFKICIFDADFINEVIELKIGVYKVCWVYLQFFGFDNDYTKIHRSTFEKSTFLVVIFSSKYKIFENVSEHNSE